VKESLQMHLKVAARNIHKHYSLALQKNIYRLL